MRSVIALVVKSFASQQRDRPAGTHESTRPGLSDCIRKGITSRRPPTGHPFSVRKLPLPSAFCCGTYTNRRTTMAKIGYARVSSQTQNLDRQQDAFEALALDRVFSDKASGRDIARPGLQEMLSYIRAGDTLYVESISRLARSVRDLLSIVEQLEQADCLRVVEGKHRHEQPRGALCADHLRRHEPDGEGNHQGSSKRRDRFGTPAGKGDGQTASDLSR